MRWVMMMVQNTKSRRKLVLIYSLREMSCTRP